MTDQPLEGILQDLAELGADQQKVTLRELVETLQERGYGPMLAVLSLLLVLPVGAIPGFSVLVGVLLMLCGAQMLRGRRGVWLPGPFGNIGIGSDTLRASMERAQPPARRFGRFVGPRLSWVINGQTVRVIAALVLFGGFAMIFLSILPALPLIAGVPILLFGIGLTLRDGALVIAGFVLTAPALVLGASLL